MKKTNKLFALLALLTPPFVGLGAVAANESGSAGAGSRVVFMTTADGTAPFSYQWHKDGAPITGATSDTLTIDGAKASDSGVYSVTVSNSIGSANSNGYALAIISAPASVKIIRTQ